MKLHTRNWSLQYVLSVCMLFITFYSPHSDTRGLCSSEELRGGKRVPASLPHLWSRENSRTVELYRSVLEINFPAEGCMMHAPPVLLRACIGFWRSVIISECLFISLRWRGGLCCGNHWLGNSPFCPLQENLGRLARLYSLLRTFLETWFLLSFKDSHLTGDSDEVSFSFFHMTFFVQVKKGEDGHCWFLLLLFLQTVFFFCAVPFQHKHFKDVNAPVKQCLSLKLADV